MKRLIAQIGLTYLSVLSVVFYFGNIAAYVIGGVSLIFLLIFLTYEKCRKTIYLPVIASVALLACVVNLTYTAFVYEKTVDKYENFSGKVTATLIEEPNNVYGTNQYMFKTKTLGDTKDSIKILVMNEELLAIEPFDVVEMELELYEIKGNSALSKKCFLAGSFGFDEPMYKTVDNEHWRFRYHAIKLRQKIRSALKESLSDDAFSLCSALLIGDKYALSDEVRNNFNKAGVTHLIVVSGMHFSILASGFLLLSQRFWQKRHIFVVMCVLFILLYMAVTGFSPSVIRSGVMLLVCCLGLSMAREPFSENSLGLAAIVVTITNPYSVSDVGLILSFASTFSIIKFAPILSAKFCSRIKFIKYKGYNKITLWLSKKCNKAIRGLVGIIAMNISAFIVSLPLSIAFFGATSTVSIISTFVLHLPINLLLIITFALALVYYIPVVTLITPILTLCIELLTYISLWLVNWFASLPFSYVTVNNGFVYLWLIMYAVLFVMMLLCDNKIQAMKVCALSLAMVFLAGYITSGVLSLNTSKLNVLDVGDGTAVMYTDSDISAVLKLDCNQSNNYLAVDKIERMTNSVDFCSSVSDTTTSVNSLYALTKAFAISDVLLYDTRRSVEFGGKVGNMITPSDDFTVELNDNARVNYLMTDDGYIIFLNARGCTTLILPPFIDARNIPENYRTADYIIMNNNPINSGLLSCDTLIVSNCDDYSSKIMKFTDVCCNRVLLTVDGDIEIVLEV